MAVKPWLGAAAVAAAILLVPSSALAGTTIRRC